MPELERAILNEHVTVWKQRLGLGRWTIAVKFEPQNIIGNDGGGSAAQCHRHDQYDRAVISFSPFLTGDGDWPECLEQTIWSDDTEHFMECIVVHELLHCVMRDIMTASEHVDFEIAGPSKRIWDSAWKVAEEQTVDRLAHALVDAFANPDSETGDTDAFAFEADVAC